MKHVLDSRTPDPPAVRLRYKISLQDTTRRGRTTTSRSSARARTTRRPIISDFTNSRRTRYLLVANYTPLQLISSPNGRFCRWLRPHTPLHTGVRWLISSRGPNQTANYTILSIILSCQALAIERGADRRGNQWDIVQVHVKVGNGSDGRRPKGSDSNSRAL